MNAWEIAREGWRRWASKPHNRKWVRRVEGTPIPNDLTVNMMEAIRDARASELEELQSMRRIVIRVEPAAGVDPQDCLPDMVELAIRLDCPVRMAIDDYDRTVIPGDKGIETLPKTKFR